MVSRLTSFRDKSSRFNEANAALKRHLEFTHERCLTVKTLVHRDKPTPLADIYVPLRFSTDKLEKTQNDLISETINSRFAIISGTGGSGKSIFMKFLWFSFHSIDADKIPLFIELRALNDINSDNIESFILSTVFSTTEKASNYHDYFHLLMEDGRFVILLDGFDEVSEIKKPSIERDILRRSRAYPKNIYIISTRPSVNRLSWERYTTYNVLPMNIDETVALIERIRFSEAIKKRFILAIRKSLFKTHQTFLEIPLLASLMLVAFDQFADIPRQMHIFYSRAFETIFLRHDGSKDGFNRILSCGLDENEFIDVAPWNALALS